MNGGNHLRTGKILKELKYHNTVLRVDDGTRGWSAEAPFDAILVAAGSPQIPETLKQQLANGGRMIIPVGGADDQKLIHVLRIGDKFQETELGMYKIGRAHV